MKKIGLYGGAFDPIHNQHLINATRAYEQLGLDEVWFIPSKEHAFKGSINRIDTNLRLKMIELALKDEPHFHLNKIELEAHTTQYTIDTVNQLKKRYPDDVFYLIIGGDNLDSFHLWKSAELLLKNVQLVCSKRKGVENRLDESLADYSGSVHFLTGSESDLSSSFIRNTLREGNSIRYYVPKAVETFVLKHKLYTC